MKYNKRAFAALKLAFERLSRIDRAEELSRQKLTLAEYAMARDCFCELRDNLCSKVISLNVAKFFERCGFHTVRTNVQYEIVLPN